jgi:RNA polymerase primary sigma factor
MGISSNRLMALMQCSQELLSLDMTVGDTGGMTLGGLIKDPGSKGPDASMISEELLQELHHIMQELNEREQRVMRLRFRLDGPDETVDAIAEELKLSRERLRQIEVQAIKKLRAIAQRHRLKDMFR